MKNLLLVLATILVTACDYIPESYQGRYVSADNSVQMIVTDGSVDIQSSIKLNSVFTGNGKIYDSLFAGQSGVYIAPSIYFTMMGSSMHMPTAGRMGWPGVQVGFEESKDRYDVYLVANTKKQELDVPTPGLNVSVHDAEIFYFQADKNQSAKITEITLQHWQNGTISAYEVSYGPLGLAKTWQVTGGKSSEIKLIRQ